MKYACTLLTLSLSINNAHAQAEEAIKSAAGAAPAIIFMLDPATLARSAALANNSGDSCSPAILNCNGGGKQNRISVDAEQKARERTRQNLQERDLALAREIQFAQEHPDVVVVHSQKDPRNLPVSKPDISKVFDDALDDHAPQGLTRSYYDRFGNRHEIVNKCWGVFC